MENKIKVGIIGGAGYTGGELIRLLVNHPNVDIAAIHSKSNAGNAVSAVHGDLVGETNLFFSGDDSFLKDGIIDVVDDTKDLIAIIKGKNICLPDDIIFTGDTNGKHDYNTWSKELPAFLIWAFGK